MTINFFKKNSNNHIDNKSIFYNYNLVKSSWFNTGGPAKIFFKAESLQNLCNFLKNLKKTVSIKVLGVGSNTLIRDGGFDGVVIKLGKQFSKISIINKTNLIVGCSALDKQVSNFAKENSISNFEFLSCIPGTIGGAIHMNSGCYGYDISQIIESIQVVDYNGNIYVIPSKEIKFFYRSNNLSKKLIFISATFRGEHKDKNLISDKVDLLMSKKKKDQPSKVKTCGSTFKNPSQNKKAWELIKKSDCQDIKFGGAYISPLHCNFFINNGTATSNDLEKLFLKVKEKVYKKTGIKLKLEIEIIGERIEI